MVDQFNAFLSSYPENVHVDERRVNPRQKPKSPLLSRGPLQLVVDIPHKYFVLSPINAIVKNLIGSVR